MILFRHLQLIAAFSMGEAQMACNYCVHMLDIILKGSIERSESWMGVASSLPKQDCLHQITPLQPVHNIEKKLAAI